jgi:hypothetical protein
VHTNGRRVRDDRGQAMPLVAAMVGLAVAALLALAPVGRALAARAQARTAADAAALAAAAEGPEAARSAAEANRGVLLEVRERDGEVAVRVEVAGVDAYARARAVGALPGTAPPGAGERAGLAPAMLAALARADGLLGYPVPVVSGLRSRAEQEALWDRRHLNRYPVARPGTSDHERGLAIDVPAGAVAAVAVVAPAAGLCQPLPETDPVHFVVCGA